jgi:hypothetical protein
MAVFPGAANRLMTQMMNGGYMEIRDAANRPIVPQQFSFCLFRDFHAATV